MLGGIATKVRAASMSFWLLILRHPLELLDDPDIDAVYNPVRCTFFRLLAFVPTTTSAPQWAPFRMDNARN